jgi:uncharacterized membrane protein HdeD (DUF308 family)
MTTRPGPALRWAQDQSPGVPVRWKSLEIAAFSGHRRIVKTLGPSRADKQRARGENKVPWWAYIAVPFLMVSMLAFFYPAGAFMVLADGQTGRFDIHGIDADLAVPLAGSVLLAGGVIHLVALYRARTNRSLDVGIDGVAVLFGGVDALMILTRGRRDDVTAWPLWFVVALFVVAVGGIGLRRRDRQGDGKQPAATGSAAANPADGRGSGKPRAAVRQLIAKLPAADRDAVRHDLDAAIDELTARGVVDPSAAIAARSAELGMLSITVSRKS